MADPEPVPTGRSSTVPLEPGANEPVLVRVACPNCGVVLDPPPARTRLCPRCRRRIVVRRFEGRTIYLTDASVDVFENERRRDSEVETWTHERRHWLQLAQIVGAPADGAGALRTRRYRPRRSRRLARSTSRWRERAVRVARREKHWDDVSRIRRRQAEALFEAAGGRHHPMKKSSGSTERPSRRRCGRSRRSHGRPNSSARRAARRAVPTPAGSSASPTSCERHASRTPRVHAACARATGGPPCAIQTPSAAGERVGRRHQNLRRRPRRSGSPVASFRRGRRVLTDHSA